MLIFVSLLIWNLELGTWNFLSAADQTPAAGAVGEFVIKGESKVLVDSDKPELTAAFDETEPLKPALETLDQAERVNMPSHQRLEGVMPKVAHSDFVIVPKRFEFRPDVIAHRFELRAELERVYKERHPREADDKARWEFRVADASGWVYMQFSGKGLPPTSLDVPTRNQDGLIIRPGSPYTGVLTYRDTEGDVHTAITNPFSISGLVEKNINSYHLHFALKPIIERLVLSGDSSGSQEKISIEGEMLLNEAADWIKAHQANLAPLKILVYARSDVKAQQYASWFSQEMRRLLMRDQETIQFKGVASDSNLDERVEIAVHFSKDQPKK